MRERKGDEPVWQTVDRMVDELLRLRAAAPRKKRPLPPQRDLLSPLPDTQDAL